MEKHFDLVVIGGGPGGYTAAIKAAKLGLRTALIEARELGGTCLNRGCIPTKAMLHAAKLFRDARESARFGVNTAGVQADYAAILEYRSRTICQLTQGIKQLLAANGVLYVHGQGMLLPERTVRIDVSDGESIIHGENILLATGSKPKMLPVPGMSLAGVLDSDGLFALKELPQSLIIIGGGAIGVELAEVFSSLGSRVTIIEAQPRLLPGMDREISQNLRMILKRRGIELHLGAGLREIIREGELLKCLFEEKGQTASATAQYVLCAVGRRPNTDGLFSDDVKPQINRGAVVVDAAFQTSLDHVYAIGDLIGGGLAHSASAQGMAVAEHLAGTPSLGNLSVIPHCVYTNPEIASVGISEDMASAQGISIRVGKYLMSGNGKSMIEGVERGFIKIIASESDGQILGAQLMCGRATDMIGELTTAIANHMSAAQLLRGMRAHPSFNEGIGEALEELAGGAIHVMPKTAL